MLDLTIFQFSFYTVTIMQFDIKFIIYLVKKKKHTYVLFIYLYI